MYQVMIKCIQFIKQFINDYFSALLAKIGFMKDASEM